MFSLDLAFGFPTLNISDAGGLIYALDLSGTAIFAITATLAAGRKGMDIFGVAIVALVTAVGGGTVRDLVLGQGPVFWVRDPAYPLVAFAAAAGTILFIRLVHPLARALLIADAFGLALFAILGTRLAMMREVPGFSAVLLGVVTATVGGMLRDVLCNEVPLILRREIYATAALAGAAACLAMHRLGVGETPANLLAAALTLVLRLAALRWNLSLPLVRIGPEDRNHSAG